MLRCQRGVGGWALLCIWSVVLGIPATCSGNEGATSSEKLISALSQVSIFQGLDADQLKRIAGMADLVVREGGVRIIEQGKRTGKMAIALDCEVEIRIDGERLRVLPANSLVGEIEFLEDCPASADVVLSGRSRVIFLEHRPFRALMDADAVLGYRIMDRMARMEANRLRTNPPRPPR